MTGFAEIFPTGHLGLSACQPLPPDAILRMLGRTMRSVTVGTYRDDPLYPRLVRATDDILQRGKVVAPVDLLVGMKLLTTARLDDWRRGRIDYLERVIDGNLSRLSRLLRILRFHAHDLNLKPSVTAYQGSSKRPLRFTKTGDRKLEEAYATHFIWPGRGPPPTRRESE